LLRKWTSGQERFADSPERVPKFGKWFLEPGPDGFKENFAASMAPRWILKEMHDSISAEEEFARSVNRQSSEIATASRKLQELEAEIRNCTRAIASDGLSSFLRTRVASEAMNLETGTGM
jgi:hypothetical protein